MYVLLDILATNGCWLFAVCALSLAFSLHTGESNSCSSSVTSLRWENTTLSQSQGAFLSTWLKSFTTNARASCWQNMTEIKIDRNDTSLVDFSLFFVHERIVCNTYSQYSSELIYLQQNDNDMNSKNVELFLLIAIRIAVKLNTASSQDHGLNPRPYPLSSAWDKRANKKYINRNLASRGPRWLYNHCLFTQSIPAPGKCLLCNNHCGQWLTKQDHHVKVCPHWAKANTKAKKIKEQSEEIKEKITNIKENFPFCVSFRLVWTLLKT